MTVDGLAEYYAEFEPGLINVPFFYWPEKTSNSFCKLFVRLYQTCFLEKINNLEIYKPNILFVQ